jgi:hypothetical protein
MEGRSKDYILGKGFNFQHVNEIAAQAAKKGFGLSDFHAFESDGIDTESKWYAGMHTCRVTEAGEEALWEKHAF